MRPVFGPPGGGPASGKPNTIEKPVRCQRTTVSGVTTTKRFPPAGPQSSRRSRESSEGSGFRACKASNCYRNVNSRAGSDTQDSERISAMHACSQAHSFEGLCNLNVRRTPSACRTTRSFNSGATIAGRVLKPGDGVARLFEITTPPMSSKSYDVGL